MPITSRRARPLDRTTAVRDATLVVIATEGKITEKIYFDIFQSTKVQVRTIVSEDNKSSPEHVLARLKEFRDTFELSDDDELWLAIDRDRWTLKSLAEVGRRSQSDGFGVALSNPCFEIWLLLHYSDSVPEKLKSSEAESLLKKARGSYNKSSYDPKDFVEKIPSAIINARSLDANPSDRWPNKTGSRIYRIIESINSKSKL
ncbi:RloB family protein [Novosphingobium pituita]|uniref:RloB domain-containing protein n=1 Tax=Novosphingobium pituita TaxID=3056842 RepID=A0ABQ6P3Q5_9SPHN|nr:RloB family protein [Novosphingobium sp. IK01]GMM59878.1 hypothetical protein NUTIK01_06550 [Novosphingobium sp. IK01]